MEHTESMLPSHILLVIYHVVNQDFDGGFEVTPPPPPKGKHFVAFTFAGYNQTGLSLNLSTRPVWYRYRLFRCLIKFKMSGLTNARAVHSSFTNENSTEA